MTAVMMAVAMWVVGENLGIQREVSLVFLSL